MNFLDMAPGPKMYLFWYYDDYGFINLEIMRV